MAGKKKTLYQFTDEDVFTMAYHSHISSVNDYVVHQLVNLSMYYSHTYSLCYYYSVLPSTQHMGKCVAEWHCMMMMQHVATATACQLLLFIQQHRASEFLELLIQHECVSLNIVITVNHSILMHIGGQKVIWYVFH